MDRRRALHMVISGSQVLGVAVAWYVTSKLGLMVVGTPGAVSPWWPPTGISLVALLALGPRACIGIFLGSFCNNVTIPDVPLAAAPLTSVGETLAPFCAYLALRRVGFRPELDRLKDALALILLGAFGAMTISATFGVGTRVIFGAIEPREFLPGWLTWWSGDAMGVIAVAPFLLSLHILRWHRRPVTWNRWIEFVALLVGCSAIAFMATKSMGALWVGAVFVGWAAWRYQLAGAAPCALLVSIVAIVAATRGYGPFAGQDLYLKLINLQLFNVTVVLGGLLLASAVTQRNRAQEEIEQTLVELGKVIDHLGRKKITPPSPRPPRRQTGRTRAPR